MELPRRFQYVDKFGNHWYEYNTYNNNTQELNWGLLHYRQILYQLSYQGSQV